MNAQQLKNSILQMAVQGKLVPQDPNDEPASVLLERIRKEKANLIKEGKIKKEKNPSYIFRGEDNLLYEKVGKNEPVCIADEVPCDVPDTWEWVRLSNINDMYTGNSINETEKKLRYTGLNEGRCYIGTKDVSFSHKIDYDNGVRIPFDNDKFRVAPPNSILMCIEGGSAGRKIAFTNQEVCFGNKLCCFVSCCIDPMYLYYYLQSPIYQSAFKNNTSGIIGGVSVNVLKNMFFPVPPLSEQHRIVAKIEEVESFIVEYESREIQLSSISANFPDLLKKSILQQAVMGKLVPQDPNDEPASVLLDKIRDEKDALVKAGKTKKDRHESIIYRRDNSLYEILDGEENCIDDKVPFDIPESWEWIKIGNIFDVGTGMTPNKSETRFYQNATIPWVNSSLTSKRYIDEVDTFVTECALKNTSLKIYPVHTLIVAMYGQGKTRGQVSELLIPATTNQACAALVSCYYKEEIIKFVYFYFLFNYERLREKSEGTSQPNLNVQKIKNMMIPFPPLNEQKRIVASIEVLLRLIDCL